MTSTDALIDRMAGAIVARAPWLLRPARALMTARGFFVFLSVLMLALLLIRSLAFPGTGGDDGEQIVFAQYLSIGYYPRNPPLYAWLVHGAQYVFGVSVMAVSAVKFLAVWGSCAVLFACGRLLYRDDRIAALAALSPLAAYLLFWDGVTGLSNSILVMLPCALSFYAVLRLYAAPRLLWYLALGIFAGLGFLSKYGYGVFLVSLLAAAAFDRTARARLLRPESLLALAALAAIVAPYALWFVDKRSATMSTDATVGIVPGLGFLASAAIGASAPLWILLPLFFPQAFGRIGGGTGNGPPESGALRQIMGRQLAVALVLFAITGAVSGLKARGYYMSVMILLPLYVFARVQAAGWRESAAALFALTAAAIPAGAALALAGQAYLEPYWCKKCERQLPYDAWSRAAAHGRLPARHHRRRLVALSVGRQLQDPLSRVPHGDGEAPLCHRAGRRHPGKLPPPVGRTRAPRRRDRLRQRASRRRHRGRNGSPRRHRPDPLHARQALCHALLPAAERRRRGMPLGGRRRFEPRGPSA